MRVAFLTLNAYDMLTGDGDTVGGAQLQQILVGRELAARGHDVVFIENEAPNKQEGTVDGIRIVTKPTRDRRSVAARAVLRCVDLVALLGRINPDVCYVRVPLFELLSTAAYCAGTDTRLVYGFAHDSELTDDPVVFESGYTDNAVYRALVREATDTADVLVAQNEFQNQRASERYSAPVVHIPNGYRRTTDPGHSPLASVEGPVVLWVSMLRPWKQPGLVLEIADAVPEATFAIVGGRADDAPDLYDSVRDGAAQRANVRFEGFVPYEEVDAYFADADLFLNTSEEEGFPNTFLQAWAHDTPVASLSVDPSGVLKHGEAGICADGSCDDLIEMIRDLTATPGRLRRMGRQARTFFEGNHAIDHITDRYEAVFRGGSS